MKKFILLGIFCVFAVGAFAQELPRVEVYAGYSFTRINSATNVPAFSANGGMLDLAFNVNKWLGIVGTLNAVHNGNIHNFHLDQTAYGYMFGPRVNLRMGRIIPFFEGLWGATFDTRSFRVPGNVIAPGSIQPLGIDTRFVNNKTAFSQMYGGGLDLPLGSHLSFRPIRADYYMTRFQPVFFNGLGTPNRNRNQNNFIYSTGFNFRF
jgi:hypothetical protein